MRKLMLALAVSLPVLPGTVLAQEAAPAASAAPQAAFSTTRTPIGRLMADPQARAVIVKHIPMLGEQNPDSPGGGLEGQASGMTLRELAAATRAYTGEMFSDAVLAAIDADLAALAPAAQ